MPALLKRTFAVESCRAVNECLYQVEQPTAELLASSDHEIPVLAVREVGVRKIGSGNKHVFVEDVQLHVMNPEDLR